jgi:aconitate hydratase
MGVLPLQFKGDDSVETLELIGNETFDLMGVNDHMTPQSDIILKITRHNGSILEVELLSRIDTPIEVDYYEHGGILPFVLREILAQD